MANLVWLRSNLNSDINGRLDRNPDPYDILSDMIFHFVSCASTAGFETSSYRLAILKTSDNLARHCSVTAFWIVNDNVSPG